MRSSVASIALAAALLACVAGCQGPQVLPPSGNHMPTDAASLRVFDENEGAPKQYELLGEVEVTGNLKYGDDFSIDPIIEALKTKAAAMGANAILLEVPYKPGVDYVQINGSYKDAWVHFTARIKPAPRAAVAEAIFVVKD